MGGGLYGHVLFTGLAGTGFAYLVTRPAATTLQRLGAFLTIAAGVAAHVVWNSPWMESLLFTPDGSNPSTFQWIEYGAVKGLPFLLLLVLLVLISTRSEESGYRAIVAGEPDPNLITEPEIRSLRSLLARRNARADARRRYGPAGGRLMGQLQAAQIEYAMVRSRVDGEGDPELESQRLRIRAIKSALAALASAMSAASPAAAGAESARRTEAAPIPPTLPLDPAPLAGFRATHLVPAGGIPAWLVPDPAHGPAVVLPEGLGVAVNGWLGAWAHVRAVNGWQGWVDGRLLIPGS